MAFRRTTGAATRYRRDANGNIISVEPLKGGAGKGGPLATLGDVIAGNVKVGDLDKKARNALADIKLGKLDFKKKDLAKLGLSKKDINAEDFASIKASLKGIFADDKVKKPELKGLKELVGKTVKDRELANLEDKATRDIPPLDAQAAQRGLLATLDMSLFARRAVTNARGVRASIGTSVRGDAGYGRNLARVSLGSR